MVMEEKFVRLFIMLVSFSRELDMARVRECMIMEKSWKEDLSGTISKAKIE